MKISVVIPSYNQAGTVRNCLRSVLAQQRPADEIIVVDSSTDETPEIITREFPEVHLIHREQQTYCGQARNIGAESASGDVIAITDTDCVATPGWLAAIEQAYLEWDCPAVVGTVDGPDDENWVARFDRLQFSEYLPRSPARWTPIGPGCNFSVKGAILGSIGASVVGLIAAWWWSGVGLPRAGFPAKTLMLFGLPLVGTMVVGRLIENMDLWCVKGLLASAEASGYYGAAKYMYQAAMMLPAAVGGAMFPTLTQAISQNNEESRRELIEQSFRFVLITMLAALALVGCCARDVVTLIFSAPYVAAAIPAVVLMVAALMFSLRGIGGATLTAAGKPGLSLASLAPLLPVNIGLNLWLVPRYELVGGAVATAITGLLAAAVMLILVWREFEVLFSVVSLVRCAAAAAIVYVVGLSIPAGGWLVVGKLAGLSALYLILLVLSGELTRRDFAPLAFWRV